MADIGKVADRPRLGRVRRRDDARRRGAGAGRPGADRARAQGGARADQLQRGDDGSRLAGARRRAPTCSTAMQIAAALSFEAFQREPVGDPPGGRAGPPARRRCRPRWHVCGSCWRTRALWRPGAARNLQDPLSIRCVPQTHGAVYDALSVARGMMEIELNSAADNPLVLIEEDAIVSVGNFDVSSLAMAFDYVRLGLAHAAQVANERVQKLLWRHFSGLPTGLARQEGTDRRPAAARALVRRAAPPRSACWPIRCRSTTAASSPRASRTMRRWRRWRSTRPRSLVGLVPPAGGARADRRRAGGRSARRARAARRRDAPDLRVVREFAPTLTDETEWTPTSTA